MCCNAVKKFAKLAGRTISRKIDGLRTRKHQAIAPSLARPRKTSQTAEVARRNRGCRYKSREHRRTPKTPVGHTLIKKRPCFVGRIGGAALPISSLHTLVRGSCRCCDSAAAPAVGTPCLAGRGGSPSGSLAQTPASDETEAPNQVLITLFHKRKLFSSTNSFVANRFANVLSKEFFLISNFARLLFTRHVFRFDSDFPFERSRPRVSSPLFLALRDFRPSLLFAAHSTHPAIGLAPAPCGLPLGTRIRHINADSLVRDDALRSCNFVYVLTTRSPNRAKFSSMLTRAYQGAALPRLARVFYMALAQLFRYLRERFSPFRHEERAPSYQFI